MEKGKKKNLYYRERLDARIDIIPRKSSNLSTFRTMQEYDYCYR